MQYRRLFQSYEPADGVPMLWRSYKSGHKIMIPGRSNLTAMSDISDPPPVKWSDSKYGFLPEEDSDAEEKIQSGRYRLKASPG